MYLSKKHLYLMVLCFLLNTQPVLAADFAIITPYCGVEDNTYSNKEYGLEMTDSQPTKGLYFQSIDTEKFQWNLFVYRTEDINYSNLAGVNFMFDRYFGAGAKIKNLIGLGTNYLWMDPAEETIPANFQLEQEIFSLYLRIGRKYDYNPGGVNCSFLPWIGGQLDQTRGTVDPPGPNAFKTDDDQCSWIAGINLKADFHNFLQLEAKHSIAHNKHDTLNKSSAMANLFFTKNLGLSYRYNYQQTTAGKDSYQLLGLAMLFN
ncbi:MAG: hypothetical protein ACM3YE_18075 [Bacteroidota bacterium]